MSSNSINGSTKNGVQTRTWSHCSSNGRHSSQARSSADSDANRNHDQYADGAAAKLWSAYVGSSKSRTDQYRRWIADLLKSKGSRTVLDAACGTGIDSVMLVEEGFRVVSMDASSQMLMYAFKERWNRRHDKGFDQWIIGEGNWLTLVDDVKNLADQEDLPCDKTGLQFDAVICIGNSFAHLLDPDRDQVPQRRALKNLAEQVKPGGILLIDHRNFDEIVRTGHVPPTNMYYDHSNNHWRVTCSVLSIDGKPNVFSMDITQTHNSMETRQDSSLNEFSELLKDVFGSTAKHLVFGDYKPLSEGTTPAYYIHVIEKPL